MLRALGLLLVLVLSVFAGFGAADIGFDTSMEVWFLDDDPDLLSYHRFLDTFHSDQVVIAAWEDPELWTPEGLAFLHGFTEALGEVEYVERARSITDATEVRSSPGVIELRPLYDPDDPPAAAALRERVLGDDAYAGRLISKDGKVAAVVLQVAHLTQDSAKKIDLTHDLQAVGAQWGQRRGLDITITGPTIIDEAFFRYTKDDLLLTMPIAALVIVLAILWLFRAVLAVPLPLLVVLGSVLWVSGLMGGLGIQMTVIHTAIYPLLLGVGIASSVHVTSRYRLLRSEALSPREATEQALRQLLAPCAWTSVTTVAGLASLGVSEMAPIREFGLLGAAGVVAAFFLTFALGPWLLPIVPAPKPSRGVGLGWLDDFLLRLARGAQVHNKLVFGGSILLVLFALLGLSRLHVGANALNYFKEDDPVRQGLIYVDEHLSGTTSIEILVETGAVDGLKDPVVLAKMRELQRYLESLEGVGATVSLADYLMELREAARGGDKAEHKLPESRAEVAQLLLMLDDPQELEQLADFDFQKGRITASVKISEMEKLTDKVPELERKIATIFDGRTSAYATGMSKLIHNMERYLLSSMIKSLSLAFVAVLIFMIFAFRSVRLGLFSMIPNLMPIAAVLGLMGWVGIDLDPGTAMTGAVALGLVVDDTVHFLHLFRERMLAGDDHAAATDYTLRRSGRAIVMTSVILVAGFWVIMLASFRPNIYFGFLCGVAILLALLADLITLPAAIALIKPQLGGVRVSNGGDPPTAEVSPAAG